ncbi:CalY family protein [Herbiconiux sp. L3-i23]|uniref:CalY family protein n=1 Tax=Herbiconiux sp. L3-i23 TaxID=2905871 RepID=UPI0020585C2A|nr:CalY family protein [Herbiconiux sp. L3-i23]BDI22860.1 hypothetical protein L3i23_16360 [Herbiconiux sp. L3-i23]
MSTTRAIRTSRIIKWAAIPAALLLSGATIAQASYSAFSATTSNTGNSWTAGTVALADDDSSTALFTTANASNLKPGSTGVKCIAVSSSGTLPAAVKLYGTNAATTNALSSSINLSIVQGTGGGFGSCSGFAPLASGSSLFSGTLANFATTYTGYSNGLGNWAPTGAATETRTYQITYTVDAAAPNTTQGGTAALGFTWESQNS